MKTTERFSVGVTDIRGVFGITTNGWNAPPPELFAIPEETIINLWLAKFGDRPVTYEELENCEDSFYQWARKRLIDSKRMQSAQITGHFKFGYTLCKS